MLRPQVLLVHRGRQVHVRVHLAYVVEVAVGAGALLGRLVVAVVHQVQLEARLARARGWG